MKKRLIDHDRVRRVPTRFSWIDHRFVRDGFIERCDAWSGYLYLFLVSVGDRQGLSYYSDLSISKHLGISKGQLEASRTRLCQERLIAYQTPLYQVLSLDPLQQSTVCASDFGFERRTDTSHSSDTPRQSSPGSQLPQSAAHILGELIHRRKQP